MRIKPPDKENTIFTMQIDAEARRVMDKLAKERDRSRASLVRSLLMEESRRCNNNGEQHQASAS